MVITKKIQVRTKGDCDIIDITREVTDLLRGSGLTAGTATMFVAHSTASLTTIECEPGLLKDFKAMFDRVAPRDLAYNHDLGSGEGNGHAHVRASLVGPSVSVPFENGRLLLGTWQQIVLIDFDTRPRTRQVVFQFVGE